MLCLLACGGGAPPQKSLAAPPASHAIVHANDFDQQLAALPHLAIMFSMSWFGIPSAGGGTDPGWGNWKWTIPSPACNPPIPPNDPTVCEASDNQREIASKRRPLAGIYTVTGSNAESRARTHLFLSNLRRACDDGAKLDAWAVQLSSLALSSKHKTPPDANAEIPYQGLLTFLNEADAQQMANVIIPAQDITWYGNNSPANNTLTNVQNDAIDMVNLSKAHASALKIGGKPVLLYYLGASDGSRGPTPAQWVTIFGNVRAATGTDFYVIGTAQGETTTWFQAFDALAPWIDLGWWDATSGATVRAHAVAYTTKVMANIISAAAANPGRVAFGGVSPGFDDYTEHWGACQNRLIPRDTEFVGGQFDYLKSKGVKGVVMETWDDWTEGSEWEPDTGSGTSFLVSLRDNLANLYGETADAAGDQRLAGRWSSYGQARGCGALGSSPETLTCTGGGGTNTVGGTVTNVQTGGAISGATVSWSGGSALSDATGHYTLGNVTAGPVTVTGVASGYLQREYDVNVVAGANALDLQLSTAGKISGTVTGGGAALSGATVTISGGQIPFNGSDTTDSTGHYDEGWVPIGSYTVTCGAAGFVPQTVNATVATGQTTTVNCALSQTCNEQPVITQPHDGESADIGSAINLHVSAGSCVNTMKVYIDDQEVQTINGNVSPVPPSTTNWIGGYSEGVQHRLVVVGFANDAGTASTTIHFTWP